MDKRVIICLHIGYWLLGFIQLLVVGLGTGVLGSQIDWRLFFTIVLPVNLIQTLSAVAFFYINYLVLIPRVLKRRGLLGYLAALALTILLFTPLYYIFEQHLYPLIGWKTYTLDLNFPSTIMVVISANFLNIFLGLLLSYLMEWRTRLIKKELIEKEQIKSELALLRSQVNPHFLFNTINDIYSLSQQQSHHAPQALLKLSELLRYMLPETDDTHVPLSKEIAYLENVIELQHMGQKGQSFVNFNVKGEPDKLIIAPMILINFLENAFKHGVFNCASQPITVDINIDAKAFHFRVMNTINDFKKDKVGGIGLANVKRRLSLIYPGRHQLFITDQKRTFTVDLNIKLA